MRTPFGHDAVRLRFISIFSVTNVRVFGYVRLNGAISNAFPCLSRSDAVRGRTGDTAEDSRLYNAVVGGTESPRVIYHLWHSSTHCENIFSRWLAGRTLFLFMYRYASHTNAVTRGHIRRAYRGFNLRVFLFFKTKYSFFVFLFKPPSNTSS